MDKPYIIRFIFIIQSFFCNQYKFLLKTLNKCCKQKTKLEYDNLKIIEPLFTECTVSFER